MSESRSSLSVLPYEVWPHRPRHRASTGLLSWASAPADRYETPDGEPSGVRLTESAPRVSPSKSTCSPCATQALRGPLIVFSGAPESQTRASSTIWVQCTHHDLHRSRDWPSWSSTPGVMVGMLVPHIFLSCSYRHVQSTSRACVVRERTIANDGHHERPFHGVSRPFDA